MSPLLGVSARDLGDVLRAGNFQILVATLLSLLVVAIFTSNAASVDQTGNDAGIRAFFQDHCLECHDAELSKGGLRLDTLSFDLAKPEIFQTWVKIHDQIAEGNMPPKKRPDLPEAVRTIAERLRAWEAERRRTEGRAPLRRLSRAEYRNAVRELLAVDVDPAEGIPAPASVSGYDKTGATLNLSPTLLECYLQAADVALTDAIVHGARPEVIRRRFSFLNDKAAQYPKSYLLLDDAVVFFTSGYSRSQLGQFEAPVAGRYRFRISAYAHQSEKPVVYRVYGGDVAERDKKVWLIDHFETGPEGSETVVETRLEPGESILIVPYDIGHDFRRMAASEYRGAGLAVRWVEVEGPLLNRWPPEGHRRLFGGLSANELAHRLTAWTGDPPRFERNARGLIGRLLPRAFRRPVEEAETNFYLELYRERRAAGDPFEDAMRTVYRAVLCSPEFLLLPEGAAGRLDDHAVASRLSFFLWNSPPDSRLRELAVAGKLRVPTTLRAETERLLDDPRAERFIHDFLGQWLKLRDIDFTTPDNKLYPEFDSLLQVSMVRETELFFAELLRRDLSLLNLLDSDFSMLNGRLARHYGISGVEGVEFRRVALPPEARRGGVWGHASVLKVTANGTTTSPVIRGVWVLDRLLGRPVGAPPGDVPAIEPDIRGATTIRDQLAKHRAEAACARCHDRIDPVGFALENFDVIGGWRERYRALENGEPVDLTVRGEKVAYRSGARVESADVTADGRRFTGFTEFKALALEDSDRIAENLAAHLFAYATGAKPGFSDREEMVRIVGRIKEREFGLRSLIHEVVQSELFLGK